MRDRFAAEAYPFVMNRIFYNKLLPTSSSVLHIFSFPSTSVGKKNPYVETLRGLAIILVVFGHMIGYTSDGGMRVADDSIFRYLYYSLEYIRLPLFTVISGWVYANKPIEAPYQRKFLKGKFRRLLIPMYVIGTLLFLFRMFVPGTNTKPDLQNLPFNLILPYDVFWYLFSLFLIFVTITLLDTRPFFRTIVGWLTTLLCSFIFLFISENFLDPIPNVFSFKGAAYLFPYFLIGVGIFRYKERLLNDKMTFIVLLLFFASVVIQQMVWFGYFPVQEKHSVLGMAVGITGVLLLFRLNIKNRVLMWIGGFAYSIFLFHVFFTGGTRIVLLALGFENQWIILTSGVFLAILFSILMETVIRRSSFLQFFLLGLKKNKD